MSWINSAYGWSEDWKWVHLHTKDCTNSFETIYPIVERVTSLLSGSVPTQAELIEFVKRNIEEDIPGELTDTIKTQRAKEFIEFRWLNWDLSDIPIAAKTAINEPYKLFSNLCPPIEPWDHNVPDSSFIVYDFSKEEIPDDIIKALEFRCFGFYYYILWTTRREHYRHVIEEVVRLWKPIKWRLESDVVILQEWSKVIIQTGIQYHKLWIYPRYHLDSLTWIFSFLYKRQRARAVRFNTPTTAPAYNENN